MARDVMLSTITVRIVPPPGEDRNEVMDPALDALESQRTPEQIAEFVRSHILNAPALRGFMVTAEYDLS